MEHVLANTELLAVWERGRDQSATSRALNLLTLLRRDSTIEDLATLSIGQRDERLLHLRTSLFGPQMTGQTMCPACGERLTFGFSMAELNGAPAPSDSKSHALSFREFEVSFRLPNSLDLEAVASNRDASTQIQTLLNRCLLSIRRNGEEIAADQLPGDVADAISDRMGEVDPWGEIELALNCATCGRHWEAPLDIASFLWGEIQACALRLLREVHALASAYGWSEAEILAMSSARRQAYLELAEQS